MAACPICGLEDYVIYKLLKGWGYCTISQRYAFSGNQEPEDLPD